MKLMRGAAAIGIAKVALDQARKPENQAKIKDALAKVRSRGKSPARRRPLSRRPR
jgi:hypothetical protein